MSGYTQALLWQQLERLLPDESLEVPVLCVAYSGGLDSTVLLHTLAELQVTQKFSLKAVHINHQLQDTADAWSVSCREFCKKKHISFQNIKVSVTKDKKGPEAAARKARYTAFDHCLNPNDILLTAHHLDDQVETVFLQLLRGSGIDGASAISLVTKRNHYYLMRPLLSFERQQLLHYAKEVQLTWVEDPSNEQTHFNRNYLRQNVLPMLEARWPAYRKTIARFSNHARVTANVLDDYIRNDFRQCFDASNQTLKIEALKLLVLEKRLFVIRCWIKHCDYSIPSERILLQIHEALFAVEDANPLIEWDQAQIRRYRNQLYLFSRSALDEKLSAFEWNGKTRQIIKGLGDLDVQTGIGQGILERYTHRPMKIKFRQGGEKCSPTGRKGRHSLKKMFQEYAIPPWLRSRIPLLIIDNEIAAVIGYFYCAPFAANQGEPGVIINLLKSNTTISKCY